MHRSSSENEIEALDAEIRVLEARLYDLRLRRNTLSTVCMLPAEIVVKILEEVRGQPDPTDPVEHTLSFRWTSTMLTCRRWRAIALESKELWTFVEIRHNMTLEWLERYVGRSGDLPLTLQLQLTDDDYSWPAHVTDYLALICPKVHSLLIWTWMDDLDSGLDEDKDRIVAMAFQHATSVRYISIDVFGIIFTRHSFAEGCCSSLRELRLRDLRSFDHLGAMPDMPALTVLDLHSWITDGVQDVIQDLVQCAPRLETLHIRGVSEQDIEDDEDSAPMALLPQLRELYIGGPSSLLDGVLKRVPLPSHRLFLVNIDRMTTTAAKWDTERLVRIYSCLRRFCEITLLDGSLSENQFLDLSGNKIFFALNNEPHTVFYHANCTDVGLSLLRHRHQQYLRHIITVTVDRDLTDKHSFELLEDMEAWPNTLHLVFKEPPAPDVMTNLWTYARRRAEAGHRLKSIQVGHCEDLDDHSSKLAFETGRDMELQGIVGQVMWTTGEIAIQLVRPSMSMANYTVGKSDLE